MFLAATEARASCSIYSYLGQRLKGSTEGDGSSQNCAEREREGGGLTLGCCQPSTAAPARELDSRSWRSFAGLSGGGGSLLVEEVELLILDRKFSVTAEAGFPDSTLVEVETDCASFSLS